MSRETEAKWGVMRRFIDSKIEKEQRRASTLLAKTAAGRFEQLVELYAPNVELEDGTVERDPAKGVISLEQLCELMAQPVWEP